MKSQGDRVGMGASFARLWHACDLTDYTARVPCPVPAVSAAAIYDAFKVGTDVDLSEAVDPIEVAGLLKLYFRKVITRGVCVCVCVSLVLRVLMTDWRMHLQSTQSHASTAFRDRWGPLAWVGGTRCDSERVQGIR